MLLAITLMALGLLTSHFLYGRLATPLGLFAILWEGGLVLVQTNLIRYVPIPTKAYWMLHGSFALFLVASAAFPLFRRRRPLSTDRFHLWDTTKARTLGRILMAFGLLGIFMSLLQIAAALGLFAVFSSPVELVLARVAGEVGLGIPGYLRLLLLASIPLLKPRSRDGIVVVLAASLYAFLSSERGFLLHVVLLLGVTWFFERDRPQRHRTTAMFFLLLVLFGLGIFVRGGRALGKERVILNLLDQTKARNEALPDSLNGAFAYFTGGFVAFGQYVNQVPPGTVGAEAVVTPLTRIRGEKENTITEFRNIPFPFNLYTYLRSWYDAFGVPGVYLGPVLFGALASICYSTRDRSVRRHCAAVVLTAGILGGVCAPMLSYSSFLFLLALSCVLPPGGVSTQRWIPWIRAESPQMAA